MADDLNMRIIIEAQNNTSTGFDALSNEMTQLQKLITDISAAFEEFTASGNQGAQSVAKAIDEINGPIEEVAQQLSIAFEAPAREAEEQLSQIAEGLNSVKTTAETVANEISTAFEGPATVATEELSRIGEGLAGVATAAGESANAVVADYERAAEESQAALERIRPTTGAGGASESEGLLSMSGQMNSMYAGMTMGMAAAPLDAGLEKSIKSFADFDQSMRLVNQEMKLGQDGFSGLEQSIMAMSNQTGISADELSKGLYNVVAKGITDQSQALEYLRIASDGAKAGNTDLDTSTRALDAVMGAYGLTADKSGHIMDVMFTAVNNGQMHFDDLARSVGASATMAATAGINYEELAAAQATLTNVGKNAQVASQGLNAMITGIVAPTSGATKEAKALGIEWDATALKAHGLTYMIKEAMTATGGNTEELKKLIPNQRAFTSELALGGSASDQYSQTLDQMKDSAGATSKALDEYNKGTGESLKEAETSIQNAGMSITESLTPAIVAVSKDIEEFAGWLQSLSPETRKMIGEVALGAAAFLTIGSAAFMSIAGLGALKMGVTGIIGAFGGAAEVAPAVVGGLESVAAGAATLGTGAEVAAGTTAALGVGAEAAGVGMTALLGPVGLAALAVAGVGVVAYNTSPKFKSMVDDTKNWFTGGNGFVKTIEQASNKTVANIVDMTQKVDTQLTLFKTQTGAISNDTANSVIAASQTMHDTSIKIADDRLAKETADANQLKDSLKGITQEQYDAIIAKENEQHDSTIKMAQDTQAQVTAEITKMKDAGINVTDQMKDELIKNFDDQRDGAIKAVSDTDLQYSAIMAKLHASSGQITAQTASEAIIQADKQRDGAVAAANDQYDKTVAAIVEMRDKFHTITPQMADDMIADATRQHDDTIEKARDMNTQVVGQITTMAGDSAKQLDTNTGEMLTGWQQFCNSMVSKASWLGSEIASVFGSISSIGSKTSQGETTNLAGYVESGASPSAIGHLASGTDDWRGGWTMVGENGPELLNLPGGSKVIPNDDLPVGASMSSMPTGGYGSAGDYSATSSQNRDLLQAITGLTAALSKTTSGSSGGTNGGYNQNAPLMHIQNMTVRSDSDLQQQQRMLYNSQQSTLRALGIRS